MRYLLAIHSGGKSAELIIVGRQARQCEYVYPMYASRITTVRVLL